MGRDAIAEEILPSDIGGEDVSALKFFIFGFKGLHAVALALADGIGKADDSFFSVRNALTNAGRGEEEFEHGDLTVVVFLGEEPLGNDSTEAAGEPGARSGLLHGREEAQEARDGARSVWRVDSGEDQVPTIGGFEGEVERVTVWNFAEQDDVGRMAKCCAQGERKGGNVAVQLAL